MSKLKEIAAAMSKKINHDYQKAASYVPDVTKVESVMVSNWVELPEDLQDALELPGLPIGNITHVYGKPNTGKTTLLMQTIKSCQDQDILPILILTEHKFDFSRLPEWMQADPEQMIVLHADNLEEAYGFMEKILRDIAAGKLVIEDEEGNDMEIDLSDQMCYILMDSLGNTMSESELDYDVQDHAKSMGKAAKAIKTLTRRVNGLLSRVRQQCGILLLNQSYMSMPSYGPSVETPYGGDGVIYSCALNIRLRRIKDIKMTMKGKDVVIGLETQMEVKKNHITHKMPIARVYTVASGMMAPTTERLKQFKKLMK